MDTNFPELYESHEAGHVVAASTLGLPYSYVTVEEQIISDGSTAAAHISCDSPLLHSDSREVRTPIPEHLRDSVWPLATFSLAGVAASIANTPADRRPFDPVFFRSLAENDLKLIDDLFREMRWDSSEKGRLASETVDLVWKQWPAIYAVTKTLLIRQTIYHREAELIIAGVNRSRSTLEPTQSRHVILEVVGHVVCPRGESL